MIITSFFFNFTFTSYFFLLSPYPLKHLSHPSNLVFLLLSLCPLGRLSSIRSLASGASTWECSPPHLLERIRLARFLCPLGRCAMPMLWAPLCPCPLQRLRPTHPPHALPTQSRIVWGAPTRPDEKVSFFGFTTCHHAVRAHFTEHLVNEPFGIRG